MECPVCGARGLFGCLHTWDQMLAAMKRKREEEALRRPRKNLEDVMRRLVGGKRGE
jgi:hypothetical protein